MLLALLLFIGAGALLFLSFGGETSSSGPQASAVSRTEKYQNSVNRHLMLTNENIRLEQQKMALEYSQELDRFRGSKAQRRHQTAQGLDLSTDARGFDIANEIGRGVRPEAAPGTPDEAVQRELYDQEQDIAYEQAYREEYARQFVENARRGGYKVILSEDLTRVLSVVPIRKPSQNFNLGGSSGGTVQ